MLPRDEYRKLSDTCLVNMFSVSFWLFDFDARLIVQSFCQNKRSTKYQFLLKCLLLSCLYCLISHHDQLLEFIFLIFASGFNVKHLFSFCEIVCGKHYLLISEGQFSFFNGQ